MKVASRGIFCALTHITDNMYKNVAENTVTGFLQELDMSYPRSSTQLLELESAKRHKDAPFLYALKTGRRQWLALQDRILAAYTKCVYCFCEVPAKVLSGINSHVHHKDLKHT